MKGESTAPSLQGIFTGLASNSLEPAAVQIACAGVVAMAEQAPALLYQQPTFQRVIEYLFAAVHDGRIETREAAVRAMRACLGVVGQRDRQLRVTWCAIVFDEALAGLNSSGSEHAAHGSLCVLIELLAVCRDALDEARLEQAFEAAWALRESRQRHIRTAIINLLPSLATGAPHAVSLRWLPRLVSHLLASTQPSHAHETQRGAALVALGRIALALGGDAFAEHLPDVLRACHEALRLSPVIRSAGPGMNFGKNLRFEGNVSGPASLEAIECIGCLAEAHGAQLEAGLAPMLPSLFHSGLSVTLASALQSLSLHVPALLPQLQALLLDTVCMLLTRQSFAEWAALTLPGGGFGGGGNGRQADEGADGTGRSGGGGTASRPTNSGGAEDDDDVSSAQVTLALETLASFQMAPPGPELLEFVRSCIAAYLDDRQPTLRRAAAVTCCRLLTASSAFDDHEASATGSPAAPTVRALSPPVGPAEGGDSDARGSVKGDEDWMGDEPDFFDGFALDLSGELDGGFGGRTADSNAADALAAWSIEVVDEVLERVLVVGVADEDAQVRYAVLCALSPRFDLLLAQTGKWELVLTALGDETVETREAAIGVLGRMSQRDPARVLPALRTQLLDLLTEIKHASSYGRKEDAASLLRRLVCSAPHLIRPYATSILHVLRPKLRESVSALATLGELAVVAGTAVGPYMPELLPQLLPLLHDHASSAKRSTALHALAQLLRSTGYPSEYAPDGSPSPSALLLSTLLAMLGSEGEPETRLELLRALGTLGAPDPSQQMQIQLARQRTAAAHNLVSIRPGDIGEDGRPSGSEIDDESIDPAHPDFHPSVALRALTRILRDTSLSAQHVMVIKAMVGILWSLGAAKCLPFLPVVMPLLLHTAAATEHAQYSALLRETAIEQLGHLISIMGLHVRSYLPRLLQLARENLHSSSVSLLIHTLGLIEQLCLALCDEFGPHLPPLVPILLMILQEDRTEKRTPSLKVLHALGIFDQHLHEHLHLIVPALLRLCEQHDAPTHVRMRAVWLFGRLCKRLDLREYASQLVHGMMRVLRNARQPEQAHVVSTLTLLLHSLGPDFAVFASPVAAELSAMRVTHASFGALVAPLRRAAHAGVEAGGPFAVVDELAVALPPPLSPSGSGHGGESGTPEAPWSSRGDSSADSFGRGVLDVHEDPFGGVWTMGGEEQEEPPAMSATAGALVAGPSASPQGEAMRDEPPVGAPPSSAPSGAPPSSAPPGFRVPAQLGQKSLKATWEATQLSTRADWHEWMRRLSVEMLRESPSAPLRACAPLAEAYQPLARELFNAAFLSCWSELGVEGYQESLVASLETALDTENMSLEVLQPLLNLAEFMELADKPLPIDIRKLGSLAERCHAYAKALHYREIEFETFPADTIEALISINNHLQQPEAGKGILTHARQTYQVELKESWYEKLQRWGDARAAYERKQQEDPENLTWTLSRMRCHRALGDWETLAELASETWASGRLQHDAVSRAEVASLAAAAAWNLRHWEAMEQYSNSMPARTVETSLVRAVLAVHAQSYAAAQVHIDSARRQLDSEFTALVGESYHRAYRIMIEVLQLTEVRLTERPRANPNPLPAHLLLRGGALACPHSSRRLFSTESSLRRCRPSCSFGCGTSASQMFSATPMCGRTSLPCATSLCRRARTRARGSNSARSAARRAAPLSVANILPSCSAPTTRSERTRRPPLRASDSPRLTSPPRRQRSVSPTSSSCGPTATDRRRSRACVSSYVIRAPQPTRSWPPSHGSSSASGSARCSRRTLSARTRSP